MRLRRQQTDVPADLADTAKRLQAQRPHATEMELDRVKRLVLTRTRRAPTTGGFMRTRLALLSILALGALFSTTGGALALSNLTGSQSAGDAVYPENPGTGDVGGEEGSGGGGNTLGDSTDGDGGSGTAGESASGSTPDDALETAAQRESNEDGNLPFTGYAAIPLLLIGVGLLATGVVLRRRNSSPQLS
jgi:hypothetical protein